MLSGLGWYKGVPHNDIMETAKLAAIEFAGMALNEDPRNAGYAMDILREAGVTDIRAEAPSTASFLRLLAQTPHGRDYVQKAIEESGFRF